MVCLTLIDMFTVLDSIGSVDNFYSGQWQGYRGNGGGGGMGVGAPDPPPLPFLKDQFCNSSKYDNKKLVGGVMGNISQES